MERLFSIILPTYNRASFIREAIESVQAQSYENWELIIIDDGSTDDTREIVSQYEKTDARIHYHYQENQERSAARNKGIELSKGEWICFLDSDDNYLPDHLKTIHQALGSDQGEGLFATGILRNTNGVQSEVPFLDNSSENMLKELWTKFLIPSQVCVHRKILVENQFDTRFRLWEDTHLWVRISARYPVHQLNAYTCRQVVHDESTVVQGINRVQLLEVNQYVSAVQSLKIDSAVMKMISPTDIRDYIDSKLRMYVYAARQNKQLRTSIRIWWKGMMNKPSFYLISELPKAFLNIFAIGIHG